MRILRELSALLLIVTTLSCSSGPSPDVCQVPPGKVAILIRLTGRDLPSGEFIAPAVAETETPFRGVQLDVLPPGYYPQVRSNLYRWELVPQVEIPPDRIGVLVRLFGEPLPPGRIFADEDPADEQAGIQRKGILSRTLPPGTHFINTRAYDVALAPRVKLGPGEIGIVSRLFGQPPADPNAFVSAAGERGVQPVPLPPGTHYVNPLAELVKPLSRESQRIDLKLPGRRIRSPTLDGFDISLNGTLEWSVPEEKAPALYARFGELDAMMETILLPTTRSVSRQHGLKTAIRDFISGNQRLVFQNQLQNDLTALMAEHGIEIQALTVSGIEPPKQLADIIQARESFGLKREQQLSEIEKSRSGVDLLRASLVKDRPTELAKVQKEGIDARSKLDQKRAWMQIEFESKRKQLEQEKEKTDLLVESILGAGNARAAELRSAADLEIATLTPTITANGGGMAYVRGRLLENAMTRIDSISTDLEGPFGALLAGLLVPTASTSLPGAQK